MGEDLTAASGEASPGVLVEASEAASADSEAASEVSEAAAEASVEASVAVATAVAMAVGTADMDGSLNQRIRSSKIRWEDCR